MTLALRVVAMSWSRNGMMRMERLIPKQEDRDEYDTIWKRLQGVLQQRSVSDEGR
jgi:hypothetical protein